MILYSTFLFLKAHLLGIHWNRGALVFLNYIQAASVRKGMRMSLNYGNESSRQVVSPHHLILPFFHTLPQEWEVSLLDQCEKDGVILC
jgi:hypothetical protein